MKIRFSELSKHEQEKIELEYYRMKSEEFDAAMSRAKQQMGEEMLAELMAILRRKLPPSKQSLLDKLLDVNLERELQPNEKVQLDELISEYGEDLVEKAQARYLLGLSNRTERPS